MLERVRIGRNRKASFTGIIFDTYTVARIGDTCTTCEGFAKDKIVQFVAILTADM